VLRLKEARCVLDQIQHQWRENEDTISGLSSFTAPPSSFGEESFESVGGHWTQQHLDSVIRSISKCRCRLTNQANRPRAVRFSEGLAVGS
jgi:hypothetical protein